MKEQEKYKEIKKLVETNGNKKRYATKLQLTIRQINRLIAGYKEYGKEFFVHGNRGRKPSHSLTDENKQEIEDLYNLKYFDCTYTQFTEFLADRENIFLSVAEVGQILRDKGILSPRTHKITKKNIRKQLIAEQNKVKTKKEKNQIAIDDSTGQVLAAYFDEQETLNGYYNNILPTEPKKIYIPKMIHPWKRQSFEAFAERQKAKF